MEPKAVSRNWCVTINNATDEDWAWVKSVVCTYIIAGKEHDKGEGTPHIQAYVEFKNGKRFSTLKNECPRGHFERRKGTAKQASDYCEKEDTNPYKRGEISQQGKRTDLEEVADMIEDGATNRDVAMAYPSQYVRYHKGIHALRSALSMPRSEKPHVVWVFGPTGCGKTRMATEQGCVYIKDNTKWWDGYTPGVHTRIVVDDFDAHEWNFRNFLRLTDRYEFQGETKGGYVQINSPEIWITCEFAPADCNWEHGVNLQQVTRRLDEVFLLEEGSPPKPIERMFWLTQKCRGNTMPDTSTP